jgi:hypothetical protein
VEESGHYYTVYFTSLAVGFKEEVAYTHALLAQMPDEVGWLDAANMHIHQCSGMDEYDLNGHKRPVPNDDRYLDEDAIHSLTDRESGNTSSKFQQRVTREMLLAEDPLSLKFGLLLHRLGDTFAHSIMGNEDVMYATAKNRHSACLSLENMGHAIHSHDPDYPFLRQTLFYNYLKALHNVLIEKRNSKAQDSFSAHLFINPNARPKLLIELYTIFEKIFKNLYVFTPAMNMKSYEIESAKKKCSLSFIAQIREITPKYLNGITLKPYKPEDIKKQTLKQFLSEVTSGLDPVSKMYLPWIDEMGIIY